MSTSKISGTDNVLAAIPAVLTFVPAESFILVVIVADPQGHNKIGVVKRVDLATFATMPGETAFSMTRALCDLPVADLLGVVTTSALPKGLPLQSEVDAFTLAVADRGFPNLETLFLPSFEAGAQWICYRHGDHTGVLPDPAISPVAIAGVVEGKSILASREELSRRFTPGPTPDRERICPLVDQALHAIAIDEALGDLAALRRRLTAVDLAVSGVHEGRFPVSDTDIAELIAIFATARLRDATLTPKSTDNALAFDNLALRLWTLAEEPNASHLAAVIAANAFRRGDGPAALTAAQTATESCTLAQLIVAALGLTLHPSKFSTMLDVASQSARTELGILAQPAQS